MIPTPAAPTATPPPTRLHICESIADTRATLRALGAGPGSLLGLVPTMGALHAGHLSLIRAAKGRCALVAVSLFVNPTQFAPGEDLARYPRTWEADCALLRDEGVDLLFAPTPATMYPGGTAPDSLQTWVDVPALAARLDGRSRPAHFRGVATVVAKLFNIIQPDVAFFGQKDAAQVAVLRAMVRDLDIPVDLAVCPTVREPDGLALSSRNRYLTPEQRQHALAIPRALETAGRLAATGCESPRLLEEMLRADLNRAPGLRLDYADVVAPDTLLPIADLRGGALLAVAAHLGSTRLIDNLLLPPAPAPESPL